MYRKTRSWRWWSGTRGELMTWRSWVRIWLTTKWEMNCVGTWVGWVVSKEAGVGEGTGSRPPDNNYFPFSCTRFATEIFRRYFRRKLRRNYDGPKFNDEKKCDGCIFRRNCDGICDGKRPQPFRLKHLFFL